MIINLETIQNLTTALSAAYQEGLPLADVSYQDVATIVASTTRSNTYAWLGSMPSMRKWVGDRIIKELVGHSYTLENQDYEATIAVDRNDIEDDNFGLFKPLAQDLAFEGQTFKSRLLWDLLADGENQDGYDGEPFFSTTHPDGNGGTQSNLIAGANPAWYVMDTSRPIKPMILQVRRDVELVALTAATDANVFFTKKFIWGIDGRFAAGFGLWQQAVKSKATLDEAGLSAARALMRGFTDSEGKLLGMNPITLVVGPSLETAAEKLIMNLVLATGESNINKGKYRLIVSPYLP
jgi:phage major head subunit gpT-like protein